MTIIIFLALMSFLVQDLFWSGNSMLNARKMRVGQINGKNIGYQQFYERSEHISNIYRIMWGRDAVGQQEMDMIYNTAWEQLLMEHSYAPSFRNMGLMVSDAEQLDMVDGVFISPVIQQTFMNPNTGMFDHSMMRNFLASAGEDDYAYAVWNFIKGQMIDNRMMTKFMALVSNGFGVTEIEIANAVRAANHNYDADVVTKAFHTVADSLVNITDRQVRNYYNSHREMFRQSPSRDLEYVVFDIVPSEEDFKAAREDINAIAEEFRLSDDPMQYAILNSQEAPDENFYSEDQLDTHLAAIAFGRNAGSMYGPVLSGDVYTVSRLASLKMIPDSLGAKHILLRSTQVELADSLVGAIRRGSDFASLAREFSLDPSAAANGGDIGRFSPQEMIPEFSNAVIDANVREVVTAQSQYGLHVIQVTYKSRPVQKAQIATITYRVEPSGATMQNIYSRASAFVTAAGGNTEGFRQAAADEGLSKRSIRIKNTDRTISGIDDPRELIRWSFNNRKGSVSGIMEVGGDYLVAALTDVRDARYSPVSQVTPQIRETLRNEAKARIIAEQMQGDSIEAIAAAIDAEVQTAEGVNFNAFYLPEFGVEPTLIGAITAAPEGVSRPVQGFSGVYKFTVTGQNIVEATTPESERARLQANAEYYINDRTMQAIHEESDITDMRVKFF